MAGLTFKERMKRKRAAMSPAQRQQRDAEDRYTSEANAALRKGMNPGTNKTLRGTTVGGKAVEVHKSANGMDVIRMAGTNSSQSRVFESHHGNWRATGEHPKTMHMNKKYLVVL